jgi:hypothetical protein
MGETAQTLPRRPRSGAVVGAVLAALASGGLAWWLSADDEPQGLALPPAAAPQSPPKLLASARADEAQVLRAYEQYQSVYAELGADGLVRFSQDCAKALAGDPRILDYCLAFDMYAAAAPGATQAPWFRDAEARRLALARDALAGQDLAADRIAGLQRLMRRVSLAEAEAEAAPAREATPVGRVVSVPRAAPVEGRIVKATKANPPPARPARRNAIRVATATPMDPAPRPAADPILVLAAPPAPPLAANACQAPRTRADRLVCANRDLAAAHERMRQAYERALAAGADPLRIDREQATWRAARDSVRARPAAMARLYERRIQDLEARAQAPE